MNTKTTQDSKLWLKTMFSNSLQPEIEFARLSLLNFEISHLVAMALIFVEYAQLVSQCILFNPSLYNDSTYSDDTFVRIAVFIAKLFNPGHFLQPGKTGSETVIILTALICFTFAKLSLLIYVIYIAKTKLIGNSALIRLWQWTFHSQGRVIYFFISSFWTQTIFLIRNDLFDVFKIGKDATLALCITLTNIEFVFGVILQIRYFYSLPTKSLFSAKNNHIAVLTLFQKFFIQILRIALPTNTLGTDWIVGLVSLCLGLLRASYFFRKLPLYRTKALLFEGDLIATVLSMNLAFLMHTIIKSFDPKNRMPFLTICWIIVSVLAITISNGYLKNLIVNILNYPGSEKSEFFIHRIIFLKEILKLTRKPNNSSPKNDWYYLLDMTIKSNVHQILQSNEKIYPEDLDSKSSLNQLILNHLQYLADTFSKDSFIKLSLASFYGLRHKSFGNAIRYIKEAHLEDANQNRLTLSLLILKIQEISVARSKEQNSKINLSAYVEHLALMNGLEEKILSQTSLQIQLYKEVISETPDLGKIFNYSQKIKDIRQGIEKKMDLIVNETPGANINPLTLYAEYQLKINHSLKESLYFQKLHQRSFQKYSKYFEREELNGHNAYQQTTVFITLGTQKHDHGKIAYCSQAIYGGDSQLYIGTNILSYFPPSLRGDLQLSVSDGHSFNQNVKQGYGYSHEGYLIPINILSDIFPIMTDGIYIMMMIRPIPLSNDYLLVRENGDIESPTKNIAEKLGLLSPLSSLTNIRSISSELAKINQAFNLITCQENPEEETKNLANMFRDEGNIVKLTSLEDPSKPNLSYYCNFKVINSEGLKLISLKEVDTQDDQGSEIQITYQSQEADFELEDEKPANWVPFNIQRMPQQLGVRDSLVPTLVGETFQTMEDPCFSPKSNQGLLKGNTFPTHENFLKAPRVLPRMVSSSTHAKVTPNQQKITPDERATSVASSRLSRHSGKRKVEEAFQVALNVKYYPRSWFCLFFMFYCGIITIFIIQLLSKLLLEDSFSDFSLKKQILSDIQTRNYMLLSSQISLRMALDYGEGSLNPAIFGAFPGIENVLFQSSKQAVAALQEVNDNIIKNSNFLEEPIRDLLFIPNVRIFSSEESGNEQAYIKMNTLQATSSVVETELKILGYKSQDEEDLAHLEFTTLTRNALNDLLIEAENISAASLLSVVNQVDDIKDLLTQFVIIILIWIFSVLFAFAFIIRKLYLEEKTNLIAVTKLNKSVIKNILHDMASFQAKLTEQNHSDDLENKDSSLSVNQTAHPQKPKSSSILKRYALYFLKLFTFTTIIAGLAIVNSVVVNNSLNNLQSQQALFVFAYEIKVHSAVSLLGVVELFSSNNTSSIKTKHL